MNSYMALVWVSISPSSSMIKTDSKYLANTIRSICNAVRAIQLGRLEDTEI